MARRGMLTEEASNRSKDFFGREITITELRLLPFIDFCIKNNSNIDNRRINQEERQILNNWVVEGHIFWAGDKIWCTKLFYSFMQELLAMCYVVFMKDQFLPPEVI